MMEESKDNNLKPTTKANIEGENQQKKNDGGSVMQAKSDVFLNIYANAKTLSDFGIKCKSKQYAVHKKVMMVRSSEYYKLFTNGKTNEKEAPKEVQVENVETEIMENEIIKFLYTEKVELTPDNVADIIKASTDLQLKSLRDKCDQYLRTYTVDNVLPLIPVCKKKLLMKQLAREMTDFVYSKFPEIIHTESFAKLSVPDVCRLLGAYELRIHGEGNVFQAAMLWLNNNQDKIIQSTEELFKNVHFYCLSPKDLSAYLNINTDVLNVPACKISLSNAFRFHALQHWKNKVDSIPTNVEVNVENFSEKNGVILTFGGTDLRSMEDDNHDSLNSQVSSKIMVSRLDDNIQPEKWVQFGSMPEPRCFHSIVIAHKDLFLIGGCDVHGPKKDFLNPEPSNKVFSYGAESKQWTEVCGMLYARMFFATTVVRNHIFVFGGLGSNQKILAECECYSPRHDQWVPLAPMIYARAGLCAAQLTDDGILVVGGYAINNNLKDLITSVECYSLSKDRWTMKNPRSAGICSSGLTSVNGYLYLLGGGIYNEQTRDIESTATIETYLVQHDCWLPVASMDIPRLEMATAVSDKDVERDVKNIMFVFDGDVVRISRSISPLPRDGIPQDVGLIPGNLVYVVGGLCTQSNVLLSSVECFNAALSTMIRTPSAAMNLPTSLLGTRATILPS